MSTAIEDRLASALSARAEQVTEKDLRAEDDAPLAPVVPLHRRPAPYLLASAAAAVVIAVPFVLGGPGPEQAPDVPAEEPTAEVTPPPDIGADWPVVPSYNTRADLDGDGTPERVQVRADGDKFIAERLRVEAELSSTGNAVFGIVELGGVGYNIVDTIDADSDGGDELVLYVGSPDGDPTGGEVDLRVLDLVDDFLIEVDRRGEPPIRTDQVPDGEPSGGVQQSFVASYKIQDGTLYSTQSVNSYPSRNMTFSVPEVYEAEVWAYRIVNGFLVPQPQERVCINRLEETWSACGASSGADVPAIFPAATSEIPALETFNDGSGASVLLRGGLRRGEPQEERPPAGGQGAVPRRRPDLPDPGRWRAPPLRHDALSRPRRRPGPAAGAGEPRLHGDAVPGAPARWRPGGGPAPGRRTARQRLPG